MRSFRSPLVLLLGLCLAPAVGLSASGCPGDCDGDGRVSVAELIRGVQCYASPRLVLPDESCEACYTPPVGINKLIQGVNSALHGCIAQQVVVPTATPTLNPDELEEGETVMTYVPYRQCSGGTPTPEELGEAPVGEGNFDPTPFVDQLREAGWTILHVSVTTAEIACAACGCPVPGSPIIEITARR